ILDGTGVFVLASIISFGMWLLVEAPLTSLCNILPRIIKKTEECKSRNIDAKIQNTVQQNGSEKKKL
ncbi:hypothetical protein O3G_MSEX014368, partial [Manduca sexta]